MISASCSYTPLRTLIKVSFVIFLLGFIQTKIKNHPKGGYRLQLVHVWSRILKNRSDSLRSGKVNWSKAPVIPYVWVRPRTEQVYQETLVGEQRAETQRRAAHITVSSNKYAGLPPATATVSSGHQLKALCNACRPAELIGVCLALKEHLS